MQQKIIGDYILQEKLYQHPPRTYHKCIKKNDRSNARFYLSQTIPKPPGHSQLKKQVNQIKQLKSSNTLFYYDVLETTNNIYVFTEYCNEGTMANITKLIEEEARDFLRQILNGLRVLHENDIVGIDQSLSSLFLHNGILKIGQVNLASTIIITLEQDNQFEEYGITKESLAPEILEGQQPTIYSDLFSVGVLYYRLLHGKYPFAGKTRSQLLETMKQEKINFPNSSISEESIDFIKKVTQYKAVNRMKWQDVYKHPLLQQLNIPSSFNHIEQSIMISNINRIMNWGDLNNQTFDVKENGNYYRDLEQGTRRPSQFHNNNDDTVHMTEIEQNTYDVYELQQQVMEMNFLEQKQKAFKQHLNYYLSMRQLYICITRNIYSRLANNLTNVRLLSEGNSGRTLEFLLVKTIFFLSNQLVRSLESDILEKPAKALQSNNQTDLVIKYQNLKKQVVLENGIIRSQFDQTLKITQSLNQTQLSARFKETLNDQLNFILFEELFDQGVQYTNRISQSKIALKDPHFTELHKVQLIAILIIISLFLQFRNNEIHTIFNQSAFMYEQELNEKKLDELKQEYQRNLIRFESIHNIYNNQS